MNRFLSALAAVLRSMPSFVWQRVRFAGEWISQLVAVPTPAVQAVTHPANEAPHVDEEMAAIRSVVGCLLQGQIPSPELSGRIPETQFEWICALDDMMLASVMRADDAALRDHVRGRKSLRGVLVNDPTAVRDYVAATEAELLEERRLIDERQELLDQLDTRYRPA